MPFFALMPRWIPDILTENHFRPLEKFFNDVENDPPEDRPQVIFIEPAYTDAPHLGASSDDHAPSAIKGGQKFLLESYRGVMRLPDVWSGVVMIVTYDEHGGFFDHVSPPALRTDPPADAHYVKGSFDSLGVRVPAFVISPFVKPGTVFNGRLDHTSILKFIGQKFGKNGSYSELVSNRAVGSVLDVLDGSGVGSEAPGIPSLDAYLQKEPGHAGFLPGTTPDTPLQTAFQDALDRIRTHPAKPPGKFDDLLASFPPKPVGV
jgi:phospholipase C